MLLNLQLRVAGFLKDMRILRRRVLTGTIYNQRLHIRLDLSERGVLCLADLKKYRALRA
jgi:hypothetical protein